MKEDPSSFSFGRVRDLEYSMRPPNHHRYQLPFEVFPSRRFWNGTTDTSRHSHEYKETFSVVHKFHPEHVPPKTIYLFKTCVFDWVIFSCICRFIPHTNVHVLCRSVNKPTIRSRLVTFYSGLSIQPCRYNFLILSIVKGSRIYVLWQNSWMYIIEWLSGLLRHFIHDSNRSEMFTPVTLCLFMSYTNFRVSKIHVA